MQPSECADNITHREQAIPYTDACLSVFNICKVQDVSCGCSGKPAADGEVSVRGRVEDIAIYWEIVSKSDVSSGTLRNIVSSHFDSPTAELMGWSPPAGKHSCFSSPR